MRNAELLANLLSGRSLLRGELESLLGEQAHEIAADWPSILQLAYLQGWINLRPAVEHLDDGLMGAGTAPLSGWPARLGGLEQVRGRAAHVCTRCGSCAAGRPCAVCGSADCARCEACRTLGRSRSCELLVQGMPQERFSERGAAARLPEVQERLARWKLSPAQLAAAKEALRFLERERQPGGRTAADWSGGHQGGLGSWAAVRLMAAMAAPIQGGLRKLTASPVNSRDTSGWAAGDPSSRFLLWAVTGAGKTEMLFPLIESVRSRGGLVAVATPRRDVVLELAPRLRRAFPQEQIAVLYGGSEERWHRGGIILATTHQLLRFAQTFDLVVIDELDAFPFHGDPMLAYAAEAARAPDGRTVYLSATPPPALQRLVRRGRVDCAKVPVRYHRHPLPVPELLRTPGAADVVRTGQIPPALLRRWRTSLARGAQVFIFVPKIALAEPLAALLRRAFKGVPVGATSSRDEYRADKVLSFRSAELRMLVTTTILERGVTVPRSDVYVLDADSGLFDEASLVQMAGRAGRSADDPAGAVVFAANEKTAAQVGARRQIRRMNRLAAPYLLPGTGRSSRIRSLPIFRQPGAKPDASRPSPEEAPGISEAVPPPLSSVTRPLPANQPQDSAAVHDHARGRR
ncbi:DNA/RNA helicase [Saccharibacillus sp. O16]|nr:DNA/RNA helicase [Saccharibacillus sp. O16]